jgi:elongation factor G
MAMKAYIFDEPKGGYKTTDIPADMTDEAQSYRETMVEDIAECDEALMDKYLESGELSLEEIKAGLRKGVVSGALLPVICGSATKNIGLAPLMDVIVQYMPSPVDRGPVQGRKPGTDIVEERLPEESAPFSAMVFKTIADPYAGRLTLFRVYSGTLSTEGTIFNASRKINERFGTTFFLEGKNQRPAESLVPGDIAAMAKLKETATGDTICK